MFEKIILSITSTLLLTASAAFAQAPPPPPPGSPAAPPGPLGAPPLPTPPGLGAPQGPLPGAVAGIPPVIAAATIAGTVKSYLLNPSGQVDGLLLADGKQLHFPPHLSSAIQQAVIPGASIQAAVEPGSKSQYGQEYRTISIVNSKTGATVVDQPPTAPAPPPPPAQ